MRKLKRRIAKVNMKKRGMRKICKDGFFASHWREYVR